MKKNTGTTGSLPDLQAVDVQHELRALADQQQVRHLMRFFKTGPGTCSTNGPDRRTSGNDA